MDIALARDIKKAFNKAVNGHMLTNEDLINISMIILNRAEQSEGDDDNS